MKKVSNIVIIIYILSLFYFTRNEDILTLTTSFSMYLLLGSIFSTLQLKENNYQKFRYTIIAVLLLFIPITLISYLVGDILNIDKLNIINIFMSLTLMLNIILKIIKDYLNIIGYKKISNNIIPIHNITICSISTLMVILLFKVFDVKSYITIIILYSLSILVSLTIIVLLIKLLLKNKKEKINIKTKEIKTILITDKTVTIYNIINSAYIYISIIILYYILNNKYNYSYDDISIYITNTYFYGLIAIYCIYKIIKTYLNINIKDNFNKNINKLIKVSLPISILLTIISKSISNIIFGNTTNILAGLIPLLFVYLFYDFVISTNITYNTCKKNTITLVAGLIVKIIFELPLINSIHRIGHSLTLGSILSIVLGLIISIILGIIFIENKLKLNLLDNFNDLLNIIYENIIYALTLVLFTFVVKIDTTNILDSTLVIIFYLFITILFHIIKRRLAKKQKK